jgi:4-aminobutyrate aminotransferase
MNNKELAARRAAAVTPAAQSVHPIYPVRAAGSYVWDADGKKYLDFSTGIAVMNVGHSHPKVLAAVREQIEQFQHLCFAVGMNESYIELAERLNAIAPGSSPKKTFLVNTGAEAVENTVKIARVATGRQGIVSFTHAFHGRTHMALSLTGKADPYKAGFAPRAAEVYRALYPYHYRNPWGARTEEETGQRALEALIDLVKTTIGESEVAAFLIEPVAGEGGFIPAPESFLRGLREYSRSIGALWISDEVQAGIGRTGRWFAVDHYGLEPDLIASAKALSSGFPLAAVVGTAEVMDRVKPGMLGSTFGGNPAGCVAALATLDVIEEEGLLERAGQINSAVTTALRGLQERLPQIGDVRSLGAMIGIEFITDEKRTPNPDAAERIISQALDSGLLLLACGTYGNVVRLLPPLNLSDAELSEGIDKLITAIEAVLAPATALA